MSVGEQVLIIVVIVVSSVVSALVVVVVDAIAITVNIITESLDIANLASSPPSDVIWNVFDILLGVVPAAIYVLRNVFDFLDFITCPTCCIVRKVLNVSDERLLK
jgi:hypothetical protein